MFPHQFAAAILLICSCATKGSMAAEPTAQEQGAFSPESLTKLLQRSYFSSDARLQAWSRIRELDVAGVEAALRDLRKEAGEADARSYSQIFYYRLAQLDPVRALNEIDSHTEASPDPLAEKRPDWVTTSVVLTAWMRSDPAAAFRHPWNNQMLSYNATDMMARMLARQGLKPALEKSREFGPEVRKKTVANLASMASTSGLTRQMFLAALAVEGDEEELESAKSVLLTQWLLRDPAAALEAGWPLQEVREKEAGTLLQRWISFDAPAALVWSLDHPKVGSLTLRVNSYLTLLSDSPGDAARILPVLEKEPGFLEAVVKGQLPGYIYAILSPGGSPEKSPVIENIQTALRAHLQRWSEIDPVAATAWENTLPAYLRKSLTHPGGPAIPLPSPASSGPSPQAKAAPLKMAQLLQLWWDSPSPFSDFEWTGQAARLLDGCSAAELAALFDSQDSRSPEKTTFRNEIGYAWFRKDPQAVMGALIGNRHDFSLTLNLFTDWLRKDPSVAMSWRNNQPEPASPESEKIESIRSSALGLLAVMEPDLAFAQLRVIDHARAVRFLSGWLEGTYDGATRQRLLERAAVFASPEELAGMKAIVARQMARNDPAGARELAKSLTLPADRALELDAEITFAPYNQNEASLKDWLTRNPGITRLPGPVQNALLEWLIRDREGASQWLQTLPSSPSRDLVYEYAVWHDPGAVEQATALAAKIDSPILRANALRNIDCRLWTPGRQDGPIWLQNLSESDRTLLDH